MSGKQAVSLEDFRSRLPLADIVGRHVRLQRRGRELVGLCPFHKERTASFTVVEDKGFYHCFGCGAHGNAIDFVMALEGLGFPEALERLEVMTGLEAPRRSAGPPDRGKGLREANAAAASWFQGQLAGRGGDEARAYLRGRGVDADLEARYGIGYAPGGRDGLKRALLAEGYGEAQLVEAGLLVQPEDGGTSYDRFRQRIVFPIHDGQGRIAGFGGRALGEAQPKYLNSPETPLFSKRRLLYGLWLARRPARERAGVVVAEGYMDVIALARAGFPNAVAPLGTAISEEQLLALWQVADEPTVCLDGDEAGLRAAGRLAERALTLLRPGKSLRFAVLPEGEDPDSLLRAQGREALAGRLEQAVTLVDFLWTRATTNRSLDTPERRAGLRRQLRELGGTIPDRDLAWLFKDAFEERFRARFPPPARRGQARHAPVASNMPSRLRAARFLVDYQREKALLAPIIVVPQLLVEVEEELALLDLVDPELDALRQELIASYSSHGRLDAPEVKDHLTRHGYGALVERLARDYGVACVADDGGTAAALRSWREAAAQYRSRAAFRAEQAAVLTATDATEWQTSVMRFSALVNAPKDSTPADGGTASNEELQRDLKGLKAYLERFGRLARKPDDEGTPGSGPGFE